MNEKTYNIKAEVNGKQYTLKIIYDQNTINFHVQSQSDPKLAFELNNLTLSKLQDINKIYKSFDSISKIVDVMDKKIEKKNFYFKDGQRCLQFKHKDAMDKDVLIVFKLEKLTSGPSHPSTAPKPVSVSAPPKSEPPKETKVPLKYAPPPTTSVAPTNEENAKFFKKLDDYISKKGNLKQTLFDLELEFDDIESKVAISQNNLFSGLIEDKERLETLENVKKLCELYRTAKDLNRCEQVMDEYAKEHNLQFTPAEKERFEDSKVVLRKSIPWKLAQTYQTLNHKFRETICNFFVDKYLQKYTPEELAEVIKIKDDVMRAIE